MTKTAWGSSWLGGVYVSAALAFSLAASVAGDRLPAGFWLGGLAWAAAGLLGLVVRLRTASRRERLLLVAGMVLALLGVRTQSVLHRRALAGCLARHGGALLLTDVTVLDPASGRRRESTAVLVVGDRVRRVGPAAGLAAPAGTERLDAGGGFLVPGLWDLHVHTLWDPVVRTTFLPLFVANGVTGVRDMGAAPALWRELRDEVRDRRVLGPRIVAAGPVLDGPEPVDPPISLAIGSAAEAEGAVAALAAEGVDFLKVYTRLPAEAFAAVMAAARGRDLRVAGHVPYAVGALAAARAGMWSLEHSQAETGGYCPPTDRAACAPLFAEFRRLGTWQVPTLGVRRARARVADPALVADPRLAYVPPVVRRDLWQASRDRKLASRSPQELAALRDDFEHELWLAGELHRAGVPLLAGSDAGAEFAYPGFGLHEELELLVEAGLTPLEALRTATSSAARFLGRAAELGAVEEGYLADLVLLDADPLASIANTRRIRAVILRGRLFDRAELDRLLGEVRAAARGPGSAGGASP